MKNILIAYSSTHGSTAEIAAFIGDKLIQMGHSARVMHISLVEDVRDYDTIVLGAPVQAGIWSYDMQAFIHRHKVVLKEATVYGFFTCIRILEPGGHEHVMRYYVPAVIRNLAVEVVPFAGCLHHDTIDWAERWLLYLRYDGRQLIEEMNGDFRDWGAIAGWAERIGLATPTPVDEG